VTILQLLTHSSGVPQLENRWFESIQQHAAPTQLDNLRRLAPKLAAESLVTSPGMTFQYNNFGYDLLAGVVERVSGIEYAEFLRRRIFDPSGMTSAGFDRRAEAGNGAYVASAVVPRLASGYNGPSGQLQVAFPLMFGSAGAGGMYATARDLFHYDRALTVHGLLGPDGERDNLARAFPVNERTSYGFGWLIRRVADGGYYLEHSGGNNGYNASYARYPADGTAVIVLSNRGAVDATAIRKAVARILLGTRYD
jgi:CubicO group peptidase (beta-lactamase class C family)